MDNIDEFLASLSPEETKYLHEKIMSGEQGEDMTAEMEEPNASESEEYTNGKGPNNEAKGENSTVPKALAKSVVKKKDSIPLKESAMFDEEE
jgi:hypothetical protein